MEIASTILWGNIEGDLKKLCQKTCELNMRERELRKACHVKHTCHAVCVTQIQCCVALRFVVASF